MNTSSALSLAFLAAFFLVATTEAAKGPNVLQRDIPDAFQIFASFPYGVAITDIDNDEILDCLTAKRKDFDPEAKTVTYVWSLNGGEGNKRKHVAFHHTAGATPDATNFTVGKDSDKVEVAHFRYTDYKDCAIVEVPHFGDECVLFVSQEKENDVPASCMEQFSDICGEAISLRDKHVCVDDKSEDEDY
uniref:Putative lipocalin-2 1 n=1 Tax=Amblyomma triste TaxID=251400 RepID=A0A023GD09_AMBTT